MQLRDLIKALDTSAEFVVRYKRYTELEDGTKDEGEDVIVYDSCIGVTSSPKYLYEEGYTTVKSIEVSGCGLLVIHLEDKVKKSNEKEGKGIPFWNYCYTN